VNLKHRLDAIEAARAGRQPRMIAAMAAEYGLSVDEFLEEAEALFNRPLAEPLAQVDGLEAELHRAGLSAEDMAGINETLARYYQPTD
jgi:hypothetical protein